MDFGGRSGGASGGLVGGWLRGYFRMIPQCLHVLCGFAVRGHESACSIDNSADCTLSDPDLSSGDPLGDLGNRAPWPRASVGGVDSRVCVGSSGHRVRWECGGFGASRWVRVVKGVFSRVSQPGRWWHLPGVGIASQIDRVPLAGTVCWLVRWGNSLCPFGRRCCVSGYRGSLREIRDGASVS